MVKGKYIRTQEWRDRVSIRMRGNKYSVGRKLSDEARRKIAIARTGNPTVKKHSEETLRKMSNSLKGRKLSEETKKKISLARKGKYCGNRAPRWQGGITNLRVQITNSDEYRSWRRADLPISTHFV